MEENIAEGGGIRSAFDAYQKYVKNNGEEEGLKGLDYTSNQMFFISYAQVGWAGSWAVQAKLNF